MIKHYPDGFVVNLIFALVELLHGPLLIAT